MRACSPRVCCSQVFGLLAQRLGASDFLLGPGASVALRDQLLAGFFQFSLQRAQALRQIFQHIGRGLQRSALLFQPGDVLRDRGPIEFAVVAVFNQLGQGAQLFMDRLLLGLQAGDLRADVAELCFAHTEFAGKRRNFGAVAPASRSEHA